jgi:putative hemolysin
LKQEKPSPLLIDLKEIFRTPVQRVLLFILGPVLSRSLGVRKINRVYDAARGLETDAFSKKILSGIPVTYDIPERELQALQNIQGPLVVVCNHPFGGIDALILLRILCRIRPDYKVFANYLLMRVPEVSDKLFPINPFETPESQKENLASTRDAYLYLKSGGLLGVFPAGEVSAVKYPDRNARDRTWNDSIARIIRKTGATVIPVYFEGKNSTFFHIVGMLSMRLRTALLVREFMYPESHKIKFKIGKPIAPNRLSEFPDDVALTQYLQSKTYLLGYNLTHPKIRLRRIQATIQKSVQEKIIAPIASEILSKEIANLPSEALLVEKSEMQVYCCEAQYAPQIMREIGRLREISFRATGEGTGKSIDLDIYDDYYLHLFVWNRERNEVVGGYRIGKSDAILEKFGKSGLYTISLFKIKSELFDELGPSLEMGRSFVREEYQKSYAPLMLLWMGIGHFVKKHPQYRHLFGPVSITSDFHTASQSLLVSFLNQNSIHTKLTELVKPRNRFVGDKGVNQARFYNAFSIQNLNDVQELISEIENHNLKVPILLKHYLKLGGKLLAFNVDPDFNNVVDGLIVVDLAETEEKMLEKYMGKDGVASYLAYHGKRTKQEAEKI